MSYRDLQSPHAMEKRQLFDNACAYANDLWIRNLPARAILALCRAIYLDPEGLLPTPSQPYRAYVWFLRNYREGDFLGNPRISFARQATRIPEEQGLKIARAWSLWFLTRSAMPALPADPDLHESPPSLSKLQQLLAREGLAGESEAFRTALLDAARDA